MDLRGKPLGEQGEPRLDAVVFDRDRERFLRTHYHNQFPCPGYRGIEQVALEHHEVLGEQWENHRRVFAAL